MTWNSRSPGLENVFKKRRDPAGCKRMEILPLTWSTKMWLYRRVKHRFSACLLVFMWSCVCICCLCAEEGRPAITVSEKPDDPPPRRQAERRSLSSSPSHSVHNSRTHRKQHPDILRRTSTVSSKTHTHKSEISGFLMFLGGFFEKVFWVLFLNPTHLWFLTYQKMWKFAICFCKRLPLFCMINGRKTTNVIAFLFDIFIDWFSCSLKLLAFTLLTWHWWANQNHW